MSSIFDDPAGNPGVRIDEADDLASLRPVAAWQQMYDEVKTRSVRWASPCCKPLWPVIKSSPGMISRPRSSLPMIPGK